MCVCVRSRASMDASRKKKTTQDRYNQDRSKALEECTHFASVEHDREIFRRFPHHLLRIFSDLTRTMGRPQRRARIRAVGFCHSPEGLRRVPLGPCWTRSACAFCAPCRRSSPSCSDMTTSTRSPPPGPVTRKRRPVQVMVLLRRENFEVELLQLRQRRRLFPLFAAHRVGGKIVAAIAFLISANVPPLHSFLPLPVPPKPRNAPPKPIERCREDEDDAPPETRKNRREAQNRRSGEGTIIGRNSQPSVHFS